MKDKKAIILTICVIIMMCVYMIVASIIHNKKQAEIPPTFVPATVSTKMSCIEYTSNENDEDKEEVFFYLSDYERWVVECIVMGESKGEPYEGQILVTQCILNACIRDDLQPSEVREEYQYSGWDDEPSQSVKDAVSKVFDEGYKETDEFVLYFYAPEYVDSEWHETQKFIREVGGHRFFAEW